MQTIQHTVTKWIKTTVINTTPQNYYSQPSTHDHATGTGTGILNRLIRGGGNGKQKMYGVEKQIEVTIVANIIIQQVVGKNGWEHGKTITTVHEAKFRSRLA